MALAPWMTEWVRFDSESVKDMKRHSDNTHTHREWMCYVYEQDYGVLVPSGGPMPVLLEESDGQTAVFKDQAEASRVAAAEGGQVTTLYRLGEPSYGSESRIEVNPEAKANEDRLTEGLRKENRKWTIHGHPLKDGKIYTGRQYFSSTDLVNEFCHARDNNERVVQFLVYPHQQVDTTTGAKVIHNRCRVLVFPDRETIRAAMAESNPGVDFDAITPTSGQNQSVPDGNGGMTLRNESGVNWFEFQEALGRRGQMGIVDIEGPTGGIVYHSEGFLSGFRNASPVRLVALGLGGVAVFVLGRRFYRQLALTPGSLAGITTVAGAEGLSVEGPRHGWQG
jgi:hypothetical protein